MRNEFEIKFRVQDFDDFPPLFSTTGAEHLGGGDERNLLFDNIQGKLRLEGVVLRLRQTEKGVTLTVKQRLECQGVKGRREIETPIETTLEDGIAMLSALGYSPVLEYGKHRDTWLLPCGVLACLDTLSFGKFVELEGDTPEAVLTAAERLGFDFREGITKGYPSLQKSSQP